jgi:hypothetical protein
MANKTITALDPLGGTPAGTDIVPMVDKSGSPDVTKKVTVTNLMAAAPVQSVAGDTGAVTLDTGDISGLGTAALLATGVANGNVIIADATGLPAIDGSQLTGITASPTRTWVQDSTTSYTISSTDAGKFLELTNASTITVTVPITLGAGFTCDIIQGGAGQVQLTGGAQLYGGTAGTAVYTEGQYCGITLTTDYTGAVAYVTGQVAGPPPYDGLVLSNMSGALFFDDYMSNLNMSGGPANWGTSANATVTATDLEGYWKKWEAAENSTMQAAVSTALGASGWCGSSQGSGDLYAVANGYVEDGDGSSYPIYGPVYVYEGIAPNMTGAYSLTDTGNSVNFVPIIYGIDFTGNGGYGPKWGMTFVYDDNGSIEESYDAGGNFNSNYAPACYFWGDGTSSTTQAAFAADGSNGYVYPASATSSMFTGDMA